MATPDQIRRRGRWSLVVGTVLATLLFAAVAYGDNVVNDIETTGEIVEVTRGGAGVAVGYWINDTGAPSSCEASDGTPVSVTPQRVSGPNLVALPAGIAATPTSRTFTACGLASKQSITFSASGSAALGDILIEGNPADAIDSYNASPSRFTLRVIDPPSDSTPPVISYAVTPESPDGNNGWYRSNVSLVWTVTEAESPGSLVKSGCVDQNITTDQPETTYSCSAASTGGSAGTVSVTIKRDATAPSAVTTLNSPPNGSNDWYTASPAWTTNGADGLSGLVDDPCQTGSYAGVEGTGLVVSGTCTDKAGNATSDDSDPFKYDATGPSAALAVTAGTFGSNGWYTSDVTVDTDGTDSISSPVTCTFDQSQATETAGQEFNGSCTNDAGLTTNAAPLTVRLDKTGPSAALAVTAGTLGSNGWYTSDVTVSTSGTDSISNPTSCTADQFQTTSTSGETFNGSCTNDAGLTTNATSSTVKLDKVPPTLTWSGGPANGGSYYFGSVPAAPTCSSVDPLYSGPNGCTVTGYSAAVGPHTMTATAFDLAGNSYSETRGYTVLAWTLTGFFQPVDMGGVFNVVKSGSTVPLKFRIHAGPAELTDMANVKSLTYAQVNCDATAPLDDIEAVATGGTTLRYDATGGQFVYNWKTPSTAGRCFRVTMATQDLSTLVAYFKLK